MQYGQELKENLAAEKQIVAARADEVAMAAIHADPQILEDHLAVEAIVGAFDEHYEMFSQRARAYLISIASRLVPGVAQTTHHYDEGTHDVEASPSSMSKEPIIIDISDDEE